MQELYSKESVMLLKEIKEVSLSQQEMKKQFDENKNRAEKYQKVGMFDCRAATDGDTIVTVINGEKETSNKAKAGDVAVKGPEGEEYIISQSKFEARYHSDGKELTNKFQKFQTKGFVLAYMYEGKSFKFVASWGEEMLVNDGDYLASTSLTFPVDEVYRIEKKVFGKTYKKA